MTDITDTERAAMDEHVGGGWIGYLTRLRESHRPTFASRPDGPVYSGCTCGASLCPLPRLLLHVDDVRAAYESKVEDFARETARLERERTQNRELREAKQVGWWGAGLFWPLNCEPSEDFLADEIAVVAIPRAALSSQEAPKA